MEYILKQKLSAYILANNPDLLLALQENYSFSKYVDDAVGAIRPLMDQLLGEGNPQYIIEEKCMEEMTAELRPSKFNYIRNLFEEEFTMDYNRVVSLGVLNYELINMVGSLKQIFEDFQFSETNEESRFLRYAIIAGIHDYLN